MASRANGTGDLWEILARVLDEESDPEGMPSSEEIELHLELENRTMNQDKCHEILHRMNTNATEMIF